MDKTALVEPDIESGERLVKALDEAGIVIQAALWFYFPSAEEWRLLLASPVFDREGPKEAYSRVQSTLARSEIPIALRSISVMHTQNPLLAGLRGALGVTGMSGIRVKRSFFNGVAVDDAYVYRLE